MTGACGYIRDGHHASLRAKQSILSGATRDGLLHFARNDVDSSEPALRNKKKPDAVIASGFQYLL
jgi:hypothetical protein